jgi:hypothetical protein
VSGVEKLLPVGWVRQETPYYCGPAVAQMFLKRFSIVAPQPDLWSDIKHHTVGKRPDGAPSENTDPEFDTQICFNCSGEQSCWNTTPEALQKTLRDRAPNVGMQVQYSVTADEGIERLVDSIDSAAGIPALTTETSQHHWVIVSGYLRDDEVSSEFPVQQVGKYRLNGLYVVDSNGTTQTDRFGFKTVDTWREDFGAIGCAGHPQNNRYPMVVGVSSQRAPRAKPPRPKAARRSKATSRSKTTRQSRTTRHSKAAPRPKAARRSKR